jgi:hypothetical protein
MQTKSKISQKEVYVPIKMHVSTLFSSILVMQLPNESRLFFKMRCLDSKVGLIYLKENYLKVGIVNDIVRNG